MFGGRTMTRCVLITGCSSGIGQALALAFAANGDQVIATARDPGALLSLAEAGCETLGLDVSSDASRANLLEQLQAAGHERLDILINNAGISAMGPLLEIPAESLRGQFETNVVAPVLLTQALFPLLRRGQRPLVVNIGSVSGLLTTPFAGAYCASKAALHSLSEAMRMEFAPFGVQVITVQPGGIQSKFGAAAAAGINDWLDETSPYTPIRDHIMARAGASQIQATPAARFATELLSGLAGEKPAPRQRIGHGSRALPALARWMPAGLMRRILSRRFGLSRLRA